MVLSVQLTNTTYIHAYIHMYMCTCKSKKKDFNTIVWVGRATHHDLGNLTFYLPRFFCEAHFPQPSTTYQLLRLQLLIGQERAHNNDISFSHFLISLIIFFLCCSSARVWKWVKKKSAKIVCFVCAPKSRQRQNRDKHYLP